MSINELIDKVCIHFNITKEQEVKRKFGKLNAYTYNDILSRIFEHRDARTPITEIFPEMTRPTIGNMLKKAFPNKSDSKQPWVSYLFTSIGLKQCSSCSILKNLDEFYVAANKFSGIRSVCKVCDNVHNKEHRDLNTQYYKVKKHEHYELNKAYYYAKSLKRKTTINKVTPSWANLDIMNKIYLNRPEGYHVDHIVPINGNTVCGLHCEYNLQYLPIKDNLSKSNKFDMDSYLHVLPA